jgi:hypothetical protein
MKCDRAVEKFMELDDYRDIPFLLRFHIIICKRCRGEVAALTAALDILASESPFTAPRGLSLSIMNKITGESLSHVGRVSGGKWVFAGTVIFSSILLLNFSESFIWLEEQFGSQYTLPLSIVLGLVLTAYLSIVVGCNYESVKRYMDSFHK